MSTLTDRRRGRTRVQALPGARSARLLGRRRPRLRRDPSTIGCALVLLLIAARRDLRALISAADPYQGSMIRRLRPIGTPNYRSGTDELGRDMLDAADLWRAAVAGSWASRRSQCLRDRHDLRRARRLCRRQGEHGDHAHDRRVLRLPVGAAGDRDLGRAGRGHRQQPPVADHRVHPADRARGRERDHRRAQPRLRRCRAASGANAFTIMRVHVLGNVLGPIFVYATSLISVSA
jgi:peptide/nickel transport system permease protein